MASGDEMDSLFEGMVLFNPSQPQAYDTDHRHHPTEDSTTSSSSQPLDENLFSDLTLVTPNIQSLPQFAATTTASTLSPTRSSGEEVPPISRQISRKKKRAGLRIGYGRDSDHHPPPSDTDSPSLDLKLDASAPIPPPCVPPSPTTTTTTVTAAAEIEPSSATFNEIDSSENHPASQVKDAQPGVLAEDAEIEPSSTTTFNDIDSSENHHASQVTDAQPGVLHEDALLQEDQGREEDENATISSSEMKLDRIRVQISEKLNHVRELAGATSASRKECIQRRRKTADDLNLASTKSGELEKQLEDACDSEDFEMAERLSDSLAAAEKEKAHFLNALRDAEADCDATDVKMQQVLESRIAAEEHCISLLEHFAAKAANDADLITKKAQVLSAKEMASWLSSTESLEAKKMELEIESHLVNEAQLVLRDSIEHSIKDDKREKEFLCNKRDILKDELEKLLALVKEKEGEIEQNDSKINEVERRIAAVVSDFQNIQSSIDAKSNYLQSGFSLMESDIRALSMKKKEIDDFHSREDIRVAKLQELAKASADEAKAYQEDVQLRKSLMCSILKSREDKVRLAKTEEKLSEDVEMLRHEISSARASLQELSSTKLSIQQDIASSKQRIVFIDKRVPELEAEKKVAASARNFKEAARIAAEAKSLCVEKEAVQIKMEGAMSELEKLEKDIKDTVNRLQEKEVLIVSKEKEVGLARFQRLHLISGAATAEISAALELGDLEEANLLLAEAEAADSEARKIQPIYNIRDEELATLPKHFISMELVSNLCGKQLAELAASVHPSEL